MRKYRKLFMAIIITSMMLVGCGSKAGKDEKLVVYTPNSEGILGSVIPLFEEKTGIKVEIISAGTGELMKRIESEKGNPYADVLFGGTYTQFLDNADLFQDYVSSENDNMMKEYRNKDGFLSFYILDGSILIKNTELTKGMTIESYEDLLNPELKGKIATADPSNSSSAFAQLTNMLLAKGGYESDEAWNYVESLIRQWDGKIQSGSSAVYKSVVDGEMYVGLTYEDPVAKLVKDGATNIEIIYPTEGAAFLPAGMTIVENAKNLKNAQKFIDFVLSEDVQNVFGADLTNRPIREGIKVGDHMKQIDEIDLAFEDMEYVQTHLNDIVTKYLEVFAKNQ